MVGANLCTKARKGGLARNFCEPLVKKKRESEHKSSSKNKSNGDKNPGPPNPDNAAAWMADAEGGQTAPRPSKDARPDRAGCDHIALRWGRSGYCL